MDASGSPNALDSDFELIPNADGGGVESLMCLLRSQLRQAGVHSVSSTGAPAATDSQALSKLHSLDLSVGFEPVEVGDAGGSISHSQAQGQLLQAHVLGDGHGAMEAVLLDIDQMCEELGQRKLP
jgi:hypothetical protein